MNGATPTGPAKHLVRCTHCYSARKDHAGDKCLFGPTHFKALICARCDEPFASYQAVWRVPGHPLNATQYGPLHGSCGQPGQRMIVTKGAL